MEGRCPHCGYCPTCGRSNVPSGQWIQPVYPYVQPWWQTLPNTTVTAEGTTSPPVQNINSLALVS